MILSSQHQVRDKYLNSIVFNGITAATTGSLFNAVFPAQGTTNGQREADSLCIDQIQASCVFINNPASIGVTNGDTVRLCCFQARANTILTLSSATVPGTGIFDNGYTAGVDITSFINFDAMNDLFHVLLDDSFSVCAESESSVMVKNYVLRPKIKTITFSPTTTAYQTGGIFWAVFNVSTGASIQVVQRLIYRDL